MTLVSKEYIPGEIGHSGKWLKRWRADREAEIPASFDPESTPGSVILAIDTEAIFIKNSRGKWQKVGTTIELN